MAAVSLVAAVALVTASLAAVALAAGDLAQRRLPNVGVAIFAAAVATTLASGPSTDGLRPVPALALGAGAAVVGVAVWAAGLVGAGDAKILGPLVAVEAWMGSGPLLVWLGCTIVGLAAGLAWLMARRPATVPLGTILLAGVAPSALALTVAG